MAADSSALAKGRRKSREAGDLPPLVEAKLQPPGAGGDQVKRSRILRALDGGEGASLTLVAAPAGYGKTTAVRAWCESREGAFAWVTLDEGDNDPVRLWTYVATAVDRVRQGLGRGALQRLSVAGSPIELAVDELMNAIATYSAGLVLVLDDLHTATDRECLASIDFALGHLPATARLVVITRADPALGLARLRARNALVELRADELAFTAAEAHELLVERGQVGLGTEEIELLVENTEGWPAALVLAGLWLRDVDDPGRAVSGFGGDQRFVVEYLSQEVLASLDDEARSFLQGASVWADSPPSFATPCSSAPIRRPCWPGSSAPTCSSAGWSEEAGSVSTRCSPSSPLPDSQSQKPGARGTDPSARRRVAVVARAAGRGGRARRCGG